MKITRNETGVTPIAKSVTTSLSDAPAENKTAQVGAGNIRTQQGPMQAAQQQLREMPDVDETFVNAMKEALQAGRLPVDTSTLAQAMMDFYRS